MMIGSKAAGVLQKAMEMLKEARGGEARGGGLPRGQPGTKKPPSGLLEDSSYLSGFTSSGEEL